MADDAYMTTEQVAERYIVPLETVRHWRKIGKGPKWVKPGRHVLYPRTEVERFDRQMQREAGIGA